MFIPMEIIVITVVVIVFLLCATSHDSSTIDYLNNRIEDLETQLRTKEDQEYLRNTSNIFD